jgi:selenoprotein W-related protein
MNNFNIPLQPKKLNVSIEYCVPCDYSDYALASARELIKNYQHLINQFTFIMGSKGVFEVKVDDQVIYSKRSLGRRPRPGELLQSFKELVGPGVHTYSE